MRIIKIIYIFYIMKFAPQTIDNRSSFFWRWNVNLLNVLRRKNPDKFYLDKVFGFYLRDPYSYPFSVGFTWWHPFCW